MYDATEQSFADWHLEQLACGLGLVAFHDLCRIAEQNRADFGLFEIERQAEHAARKLDHLVQHDVAEPFDARDAVAGFADNADVALARRGFKTRDLRFDFFEDAAHNVVGLKLLLEAMEAVAHTAVPNVAANPDAHSAQQLGVHHKTRGEVVPVFAFEVRDELPGRIGRKLGCRLDRRCALLHFEAKQTLVGFENLNVMTRFLFDQRFNKGRDPAAVELAVGKACAKEPLTTQDTPLAATIPCTATGASVGATCALNTTFDALVPGAVPELRRSMWQLGALEVLDGGADGVASTGPNEVFARQGIFVP